MRAVLSWGFVLAGCAIPEVPCERLAARIASCDLRPHRLSCDRLAPGESAELFAAIDEDGCRGLRDADGLVDRRACEAFGWSCPEPLGRAPRREPEAPPLLFVGGIDARPELDWRPELLRAIADETGRRVHAVQLPSWRATAVRTEALWEAIDDLDEDPAHLVCWAVGGLDCRWLVSPDGLADGDPERHQRVLERVAAVTTIATPHRGTDVAHAALSIDLPFVPWQEADEATASVALHALTNESMMLFDRTIRDPEGLPIESWAAVSHPLGAALGPSEEDVARACVDGDGRLSFDRHPGTRDAMTPLLWATTPWSMRSLTDAGQPVSSPSDGMVSVESAKWGRFRGCVPADHYDVVGQLADHGPDPDTGFDPLRFYGRL